MPIDFSSQVITGLMGTVLGVLLASALSWTRSRRERRLNLTLELYAEFHAPAFNHIRIEAYDALERNGAGVPATYLAATTQERVAISAVVHFFEKLALLRETGAVNPSLLKRFFGQYAHFWRPLLCAQPGIDDPEWRQTLRAIQRLFAELDALPKKDPTNPRP
ncbi:MAG: hypothetical protein EBZ50_11250 [Alphaproteobacteria bacterium]|jgi:hypothetical protein|nr:hypothetical protein [Alphaproteobacteria bacterium]